MIPFRKLIPFVGLVLLVLAPLSAQPAAASGTHYRNYAQGVNLGSGCGTVCTLDFRGHEERWFLIELEDATFSQPGFKVRWKSGGATHYEWCRSYCIFGGAYIHEVTVYLSPLYPAGPSSEYDDDLNSCIGPLEPCQVPTYGRMRISHWS